MAVRFDPGAILAAINQSQANSWTSRPQPQINLGAMSAATNGAPWYTSAPPTGGGHGGGGIGGLFSTGLHGLLGALTYLPNLVDSAGAEAVGGLSGALGGDHLKGPSVLSTLFNPKDQITPGDLISGNEKRNITGVMAKYGGEGKGVLGFQGSPALQTVGTIGTAILSDPITYILPAGNYKGATEVANHIGTAAGDAMAKAAGYASAEHAAQAFADGTAAPLSDEVLAHIDSIRAEANSMANAARRGGASALTKDQIATINDWYSGAGKLKKGLSLAGVPITTGGGPLGALSVARHEAQSGLGRALLGGAEGPTALGRMFGGGAADAKAALRGGVDTVAGELRPLVVTKNLQAGPNVAAILKDLKGAAKGQDIGQILADEGGNPAGLAERLLANVNNPRSATAQLSPELKAAIFDHLAQTGSGTKDGMTALKEYALSAGQHVADRRAAAMAAVRGYGVPSALSPDAANAIGLAQGTANADVAGARAATAEAGRMPMGPAVEQPAPVDPIAAHEAASTARATQSPKLIAEAEQHSGGAPQAASYSPAAAPGSPSASAPVPPMPSAPAGAPAATQEGSQALGLEGLDQAPSEGTFVPPPSKATQALEAAQGAQNPEAQAAAAAVKNEIAAVKETLASNPKSGPARYSTPYKVKMWAHAQALGINTDQSATRIEAALKKVVREQDVAASPALDEARAAEAAHQAAAATTPEQSQAALQQAAQKISGQVPDTPASVAAAKADTQIDEAGLRAKSPQYEAAKATQFQDTLKREIAAGRGTPNAAEVLQTHQQWGDVLAHAEATGDAPLAEIARINQVALEAGHTADLASAHAGRQADVLAKLRARPADTNTFAQKVYHDAVDWSQYRSITPGLHTPLEAADALQRVGEVLREPGPLMQKLDGAIRGFKTQALMRPGFETRLVMGHAFNNVLAGVNPLTYARFSKAIARDGKGIDPEVWDHINSLRSMGQAGAETGTATGEAAPRFIEGKRMIWEGGPSAQDNPLAKIVAGLNKANPMSTQGVPAAAFRGTAEKIQSYFRGALAFDQMVRQGKSLDEAAAAVTKFHFNYSKSNMSQFDASMRRVIPFYTFMRNNVPLQIQMLAENPKVALNYLRASDTLKKSGAGPVPGMLLDAAATPLVKAAQELGVPGGIKGAGSELARSVTPLISGPYEWGQMNAAPEGKSVNTLSGWVSGKEIPTSEMHFPGWLNDTAKTLGLVHTYQGGGKAQGTDYMNASVAHILDKFLPDFANIQRLTSDQPTLRARRSAALLNFLTGVSAPYTQNPDQTALYAKLDAKAAAKDQKQIGYDLGNPYPTFTKRYSGSPGRFHLYKAR